MIYLGFLAFQSGLDLNVDTMIYCPLRTYAKDRHEPRQAGFFSTHGLSATEYFSSVRRQAPRRSQGPELHLHGSVFDHGFCPVDLPRIPARYRDQFARTSQAALPHGTALQDRLSQYLGQCQRHKALANLRRLRPAFDRHGAASLCKRSVGDRFGCHGLRLRCHDDRFVSVGLPLGAVSREQSGYQTATLLDLRGAIPTFIHISDGKTHEVNILGQLIIEPGAYYLLDRGYLDFKRLFAIHQSNAFFVTRAKSNTQFKRRYSSPVDRANSNIVCDQTGVLTVFYSSQDYPVTLRRVVVKDETGKRITFLTNNFALKPELIADLYRQRWQVELFFKWIKQHLRIKTFFGTTENAVKTQIWIAVCTYVLIAIAKKRLRLPNSLHEILQILSLTMFETMPINQLLTTQDPDKFSESELQQLSLL